MHDPLTVAFEIRIGKKYKRNGNYRMPVLTIWHKDPDKGGDDDSCGWFMRAHHGSAELRKKIRSAIGFSFDSSFKSDGFTYYTGYFSPGSGTPQMSTIGITLDMFNKAAWTFFDHDRKKHKKWMKENLFEILNFAENPIDSLNNEIVGTFRIGTGTPWNREEALDHFTSVIYGWLLRSTRKWYQHPKWHIHHWRFQFHSWQQFKRRYWTKCSVCKKRGFKSAAFSDRRGSKVWHQECDTSRKNPPVQEKQ